jgi:glutamine phosphoribosylpyrophosphate amidotransferase
VRNISNGEALWTQIQKGIKQIQAAKGERELCAIEPDCLDRTPALACLQHRGNAGIAVNALDAAPPITRSGNGLAAALTVAWDSFIGYEFFRFLELVL